MIVLLATSEMMESKPEDVEVKHNWGYLTLNTGDVGQHIAIEGSEEAIKDWLRPFDGVWVGIGSPQLQEFEVQHIKED